MKKLTFIFFAAVLFAAVSCTRELVIESTGMATGYELQLRTEIDGMATKAVGDPVNDITGLEDVVKTLDVYIYGTFKGDASESVKGFHLNADDHYDPVSGKWTITPDWRKEKLVPGNSYTLYVAANSSKVKTSDDSATANATKTLEAMAITTLDDLGNAIEFDYDPSTSNGAGGHYPFWGANNDDGVNPAWLALHKKYTATADITSVDPKADRYFTHDKAFLMNGKSASFIPDNDTGEITVTPEVTLSRAASKICINVSLDSGFLSKLASEKHWSLYKGEPHWRFYNFAFNAPIFGDLTQSGTYNPQVSRFTSGADMIGYSGIDGNDLYYNTTDNSFSFSTYSYPITWTAATAGTEAPAIILILGYRDDSNTSILEANRPVYYHAYKIPVVNPDLGITSLERNKIYTINATISSEGSTLVSDAYAINAAYSIMDWRDGAEAMSISERDNGYIDVIPDAKTETTDVTDVILRGNGEQTFRLHVLKPDTKNFKIAYFGTTGASQNNPFEQTATPTDYEFNGTYTDENGHEYTGCATGQPVPYYINLNGDICNTIGGNSIQNCFVKDGDDLVIISTALPNKGVKYMKIRVFLDGHKTDAGKYMDVNIRHYPTDALMAKIGHWASRQSAARIAGIITDSDRIGGPEELFKTMKTLSDESGSSDVGGLESTYSHETYDSWNGYKFWVWEKCNETDAGEKKVEAGYEISQTNYKNHTSDGTVYGTPEAGYEKHIEEIYPLYFLTNDGDRDGVGIGNQSSTYFYAPGSATSEASAFATTIKEDHAYYYWGTGSPTRVSRETSTTNALLKSKTSNGGNIDYLVAGKESGTNYYYGYVYEYRHRVYYTGYQYFRKHYYHVKSNFKNWPNWEKDLGKTFTVGMHKLGTTTYAYPARIADSNTSWSHFEGGTGSSYALSKTGIEAKNRQMYILQLSETNTEYLIGRPILNESSMSEDDVVSPAFMIASQLGFLNSDMISSKLPSGVPDVSQAPYAKYWAAAHCASYLEVDTDGNYYYNWRLPTMHEIEVMIRYQGDGTSAELVAGHPVSGNDRVMMPVLESGYYFALNGDLIDNTAYSNGGNHFVTVRCVRDLTPEEVKALNN